MAQGSVVVTMTGTGSGSGAVNGEGSSNVSLQPSLKPDQLHEIQQYEKLLRFRDEVIRGSHPRIKPSHPYGKATNGSGPSPLATTAGAAVSSTSGNSRLPTAKKAAVNSDRAVIDNVQTSQTSAQRPVVNTAAHLPGLGALSSSAGEASRPGKVEINPVLLEKSDDLIRAEIQLQRQRIERGLKEQIEQRRASHRASLQTSEHLADFDIADVMAKAMALVQATAAQSTDDTAANASASPSDSFDDNTFYSSQHDTPEPPRGSDLDDDQMREGSPYEPEFEPEAAVVADQTQPAISISSSQIPTPSVSFQPQPERNNTDSNATALAMPAQTISGVSSEATSVSQFYKQVAASDAVSSQDSGAASRSGESVNSGKEQATDQRGLARVNQQLLRQALGRDDSPVVRAHDLSPIAPQPAHVSPLAVARQQQQQQPLVLSDTSGRRATPAQVAALRKQPSAASSPDSSPRGDRPSEKKKNKKKKRKADKIAAENAAASPYIKPEPRSPSPLTAPAFARPNKRQKQSQTQQPQIIYDEPRYAQQTTVEDGYQERYRPSVRRQERVIGYEREVDPRARGDSGSVLVPLSRYESVYDDARPIPGARPTRPEDPTSAHPSSYSSREAHAGWPYAAEAPPHDSATPVYYHDTRASSRIGMRPPVYRDRSQSPIAYERAGQVMGPPRPPVVTARVIVDASGREYIEPRPPTVIRERVIADHRGADPEALYSRLPTARAVSRRPEVFDDGAVVYESTSPVYRTPALPRRVITQPEVAYADPHRAYRERDYAMPPPGGEYMPSRAATLVEGGERGREPVSHEYLPRSASVRPQVLESGLYEGSGVYERRAGQPADDYYGLARAASVRPVEGGRYDAPIAYERRLGIEEVLPARDYASIRSASVRPGVEAIRYEAPRELGGPDARVGSVRPEMMMPVRGGDYAPAGPAGAGGYHLDARQQPAQQTRAYSVVPGGEAHQTERYYARGPPPLPSQDDDDVIFVDRHPREAYRG